MQRKLFQAVKRPVYSGPAPSGLAEVVRVAHRDTPAWRSRQSFAMTQTTESQDDPSHATFGSTVTVLFSDIRGFTEYTDTYGDEAAYRMLQHHNTVVQEQIALYGGRVIKRLGDSFTVSFDSARTAVTWATARQRSVDQYNRIQQGAKIEIGINTGEPIHDAGDLFRGGLNLASRICAAAGPDQTLISETVRNLVGRVQG